MVYHFINLPQLLLAAHLVHRRTMLYQRNAPRILLLAASHICLKELKARRTFEFRRIGIVYCLSIGFFVACKV
jgi:hypothetical protein